MTEDPYIKWRNMRRSHNTVLPVPPVPDVPATMAPTQPSDKAKPRFRYVDGPLALGDIPAGWTPADWHDRLRYRADQCEALHPDKASMYRSWADQIDAGLEE